MHHGDLVVGDTDRRFTLTNDMLHHDVVYPPYEGMELGVWPAVVFLPGEVVAEEGRCVAEAGRGAFPRCEPPQPARSVSA